jgi:hypothetical protein
MPKSKIVKLMKYRVTTVKIYFKDEKKDQLEEKGKEKHNVSEIIGKLSHKSEIYLKCLSIQKPITH